MLSTIKKAGLIFPLSAGALLGITAKDPNDGRDPFNQNFRKFRSKTQWIGSVQPGKFRKKWSTFRGGLLFSVGPVRSKWTVPFDHSDPFSIPGPRCSVSSMYKMEENTYHFMDC